MADETRFPIYTFIADGYFSRAYAYDRTTRLFLLKKDEQFIKLVDLNDLERIVEMMTHKIN